jgi:hypothetical protein
MGDVDEEEDEDYELGWMGVYIYKYDERTNGGGEHLGGKRNQGRDCMYARGWRHRFFGGLSVLGKHCVEKK